MRHGTKYPELFAALAADFHRDDVRSRTIGNRQIYYVTARTVMNRLDDVLGPENWWDEYSQLTNGIMCKLTIRLPDGEEITKSDAGGYAGMSDEGDDEKSGFSDAFKRAAVKHGIGRILYGEGTPNYRAEDPPPPPQPQPAKPSAPKPPPQPQPARPVHRAADTPPPRAAVAPGVTPRNGEPRPINNQLPVTGPEFHDWVVKQQARVRDRVRHLRGELGFPAKCADWNREEVRDMLEALGAIFPGARRAKTPALAVVGAER